jgi:hypothetical protein
MAIFKPKLSKFRFFVLDPKPPYRLGLHKTLELNISCLGPFKNNNLKIRKKIPVQVVNFIVSMPYI